MILCPSSAAKCFTGWLIPPKVITSHRYRSSWHLSMLGTLHGILNAKCSLIKSQASVKMMHGHLLKRSNGTQDATADLTAV